MSREPHSPVALLCEALRRLFADEAVPLAGNIAFRCVFSLFPFLIFLTALAGFFGNEDLAEKAVTLLLGAVPEQIARPLAGEIRNILTVPRADFLSLAALLTIWSAMAGVDSIRVGLNRAYDFREHRSTLWLYGLNVLFIIGAAILMIAVSFLIIFVPIVLAVIEKYVPGTRQDFTSLEQLRYPLALVLLFAGLYVAHRVLPAKRLAPRKVLPGVALTVLVWIMLAAVFSEWLLRFNSFASTYASLGGTFAAMFFVYLGALVLILGGEVNRVLMNLGANPPNQPRGNKAFLPPPGTL
jgi:membrane protein